jgi:hypothetical protein
MQVWCFVGTQGFWALSGDDAGQCLPDELGPWTFRKVTTLTDVGEDEREAKALIREHGYCCFDATAKWKAWSRRTLPPFANCCVGDPASNDIQAEHRMGGILRRVLKWLGVLAAVAIAAVCVLEMVRVRSEYNAFNEHLARLGRVRLGETQQELLYARGRPMAVQKYGREVGGEGVGQKARYRPEIDLPSGSVIEDYDS